MEITQVESAAVIRKRCPICGARMHEGIVDEIPCWICDDPVCGYSEPVEALA